ncbi:hypothetical protein K8942_02280 [Candidatus Peribacteria bacterium]|nr:MAG: hypothetical protein K8942_02280 [Candidatus Peribacteria bacterium]
MNLTPSHMPANIPSDYHDRIEKTANSLPPEERSAFENDVQTLSEKWAEEDSVRDESIQKMETLMTDAEQTLRTLNRNEKKEEEEKIRQQEINAAESLSFDL